MIQYKDYQTKAIVQLVRTTIAQLDATGFRRTIIFRAPTGAGKTLMVTQAMRELVAELPTAPCQYHKAAFVWLAPNKLHLQTYLSMKNFFQDNFMLRPIVFEEMDTSADDAFLHPAEVLCLNWQSINSTKNIITQATESRPSLYDLLARTRARHIPIVCIIDEEHLFAGTKLNKTEDVLSQIQPKVEIRISATPATNNPNALVAVDRAEVIAAGMIKQEISLNPYVAPKDGKSANEILLEHALTKRTELSITYERAGTPINPLLLIQLPNDSTESLSSDDTKLKDNLLALLKNKYGICTEDHSLAIWLSTQKINLEGLEEPSCPTKVLLFKQAVAFGWDCPRASVLLIYRDLKSSTFTIQTVGRIMRMPQQKHYFAFPTLNKGYVYTNLSADQIRIIKDDMNYLRDLRAVRKDRIDENDPLAQIVLPMLPAYKIHRSNTENNRLKVMLFKKLLEQVFLQWTELSQLTLWDEYDPDDKIIALTTKKLFEEGQQKQRQLNRELVSKRKGIVFDVQSIQITLPVDMVVTDEYDSGDYEQEVTNKNAFAKTMTELQAIFDDFLKTCLSGWSVKNCLSPLKGGLLQLMEKYFGLFELDAIKVILYHLNKEKFADLINKALEAYKNKYLKRSPKSIHDLDSTIWSLPPERLYDSDSYEAQPAPLHALQPFYEAKDASKPEQCFRAFLEQHAQSIQWWYKNGDQGSDHFSIAYNNCDNNASLFFVDFIILLKNNTIALFDTKTMGSDIEAAHKHNALVKYLAEQNEKDGAFHFIGGVLILDHNLWRYSELPIVNTTDLTGWSTFSPDDYQEK